MNKYIKAEELKKIFCDTEDAEYTRWTLAGVIGEIDDIEAADVEEVCRCEHCSKSMEHLNGRWCKIHQTMVQNSDYCCWGVRKDG